MDWLRLEDKNVTGVFQKQAARFSKELGLTGAKKHRKGKKKKQTKKSINVLTGEQLDSGKG